MIVGPSDFLFQMGNARRDGKHCITLSFGEDLSLDSLTPAHSHYHLTVSTEAWSVSRKILIPCSGRCLGNVKSGWIVKVSERGKCWVGQKSSFWFFLSYGKIQMNFLAKPSINSYFKGETVSYHAFIDKKCGNAMGGWGWEILVWESKQVVLSLMSVANRLPDHGSVVNNSAALSFGAFIYKTTVG